MTGLKLIALKDKNPAQNPVRVESIVFIHDLKSFAIKPVANVSISASVVAQNPCVCINNATAKIETITVAWLDAILYVNPMIKGVMLSLVFSLNESFIFIVSPT